ncbi:MAG: winged helix-turn-helix domain-containing protein, partial [Breznakibacter sp.]|nr:winged helix-turn-helix domain-containing protein [Breznakibacter sp.]
MPVPDYQSIMLPLLKALAGGKECHSRELIDLLANTFQLTAEERRELLPSGTQFVFDNRIGWAKSYLKKAGLLSSEKRGVVQISSLGLEVLNRNPEKINVAFLKQFDSFREFIG